MVDGIEAIHVGVLRVVVAIPGARSLKDRRQAVQSVVDRLRHRFDASVHEVGDSDFPGRQTLLVTTGGNDGRVVESVLDRIVGMISESGRVLVQHVDREVTRWRPAEARWVPDDDEG